MESSAPLVKNILLLDAEGKRVAVKYFTDDWPTLVSKLAFEKSIFTKTNRLPARAEADIGMFEGFVVIFRFSNDLFFYVTGGEDENELILASVLHAFFEAVSQLLRGVVEKKTVLENLDLVLLCLDELVDGGIILETEASVIAGRVAMRGADSDLPLSEQTISQALATAKEHLARSLLK
eukprot:TRINITY_DN39790_c0_g1_i1.p1 TRINITY_DN39790_c0_g1~~TRINITY_DN39790_c0_g1_i1.p1  ORF type:complete len:179 (+),score=56.02 TRINITY_DN39790_c0_g1_i1:252-788(+)